MGVNGRKYQYMNNQKVCQCKGCDEPVLHLDMCEKHYRRNHLYNSPFASAPSGSTKGVTAFERFRRFFEVGGVDECWLWKSGVDKDGYGRFKGEIRGTVYLRAHRFSWAYHNQKNVPSDVLVCHSCDTPGCVNPKHLWLGSHADNHADMDSKGHRPSQAGELAHMAKLTEEQVRKILADSRHYAQIAADYGVATPTINSIKNRESWSHLKVDHVAKNGRGSGTGRRGKSDRITPEIVRAIRASSDSGKALAAKFAVSPQLICAIRKRRAWNHIQE